MGSFVIAVIDLDKPIIRKDILVDKTLAEQVSNDAESLGLIVQQLIENIKKERESKEK